MIILLSLLVCLVGALVYGYVDGKLGELGHDAFWVGLLVFLLRIGEKAIDLLK